MTQTTSNPIEPREKIRTRHATGTTPHVRYRCDRCGTTGTFTQLDDAKLSDMLDAIATGHARRSPDCDAQHRLRAIWVEVNGKRLRFGTYAATGASGPTGATSE